MKKLIALTAGLLVASSAFASTQTSYSATSVTSPSFETKAAAFEAGYDIADSLYSLSEHELRHELPVASYNDVKNISVDDTKVVVEEFAVNRGEILYRAVVDVDYHFDARESD